MIYPYTLYTKAINYINFKEAIDQCQSYFSDAWGLLYSPERCFFIKVNNGKIELHKEENINLRSVFEVRIFNEQAELRWLNELNGMGKAVLLSDVAINIWKDVDLHKIKVIDKLIQRYLLWGEGTGTNIGEHWSRLSTARIGKLDVPTPDVQTQERVRIKVCEYLSIIDEHGNTSVVEERLLNLGKIGANRKYGSN